MPIYNGSRCFLDYPCQNVSPDLAQYWEVAFSSKGVRRTSSRASILRLECFLQITGQQLSVQSFKSPEGLEVVQDFIAALYSNRFQDSRSPGANGAVARKILVPDLASANQFPPIPFTAERSSWAVDFANRVSKFETVSLDDSRVRFWRGWAIENAKGKRHCLQLWRVHEIYGEEFTDQLRTACADWFGTTRHACVPVINEFVRLATRHGEHVNWSDRTEVSEFFHKLFRFFLESKHADGVSLNSLVPRWNHFAYMAENHLFGKCMAKPLRALPKPVGKRVSGSLANVRSSDNGPKVKTNLLTDIPLQITDSEAKEILFAQIQRDMDIILAWARDEVALARQRVRLREELSFVGLPSEVLPMGESGSGKHYRLSDDCPDQLAHAAATFKSVGLEYVGTHRTSQLYPRPFDETAWKLGLSAPKLLLAHAAVLVAKHPAITTSFIENLYLFDQEGNQTGLIDLDGSWYLVSEKLRKGRESAQQRIKLDEETLQIVRDLIEITGPARNYLKNRNDSTWRLLFLSVASVGTRPVKWAPTGEACRQLDWIASRIQELDLCDSQHARFLAKKFSLKRIRVQAGVLIYLETGSVEQMAKALGHESFRPSLLDHYLPPAIQAFFEERWIRLFQQGIICEALVESPYLLEASAFETMEELDTFLENHALRTVPAHLEDPDGPSIRQEVVKGADRKVVFAVELGVLTVLASLQLATASATKPLSGKAIRWARIADRLFPYLKEQTDRPEFREIAISAEQRADAASVHGLIYV